MPKAGGREEAQAQGRPDNEESEEGKGTNEKSKQTQGSMSERWKRNRPVFLYENSQGLYEYPYAIYSGAGYS